MASALSGMIASEGEAVFYEEQLRHVFEDHLDYFIKHEETEQLTIDPHQAYKYEGDMYGLFLALSIPREYYWITMRMNGFSTPTDFDGESRSLLIPPRNAVRSVVQTYRTSSKG